MRFKAAGNFSGTLTNCQGFIEVIPKNNKYRIYVSVREQYAYHDLDQHGKHLDRQN